MSLNFSQLREVLSHKPDAALHRRIFIFAGEKSWQEDTLKEILLGYEEHSLWVGEEAAEAFPSISSKKVHSWLGREKRIVIFDANTQFDADAFAAISGIVVGGGLFILLMPAIEKWNEVYSTNFGQRFIQSIENKPELIIISQNDKEINVVEHDIKQSHSHNYKEPFITFDQQLAVEVIEKEVLEHKNTPVVLISDRGRGKSAALGITAARLITSGVNQIVITAPRLRSTEIVFKHIAALLPEAEFSRGKVKYKNSIIQFYSPDQLIEENVKADLLLIDEAAAIPVPLLTSFLNKYPQCIFATTVHGYEGTGRGFALRFNSILNEKYPGWKKQQMQTPVRWAENDPLEKWMFSLLCLDAETVEANSIGKIDNNKLEISCLNNSQIANDETLLNEIFSLLVFAHYRTQPSDLQRLLDDEALSLYLVQYNQHVIAVALVSHEGNFSESLSTQVYRGERRPPGHLLAQALTYHCGVEHAATLNYARIMRIAVHPELQNQGIGSKLLNFIINNEKRDGYDAIGTSFGLNERLLNFWQRLNFNVMRIGFKREQTSGEHAAIMLMPLNEKGKDIYSQARERFIEQLPFWFDDVLKDIPNEIKELFIFKKEESLTLSEADKKDLQSYIKFSRNYELCIAAINKLVLLEQRVIDQAGFPEDFSTLVNEKVIQKNSWKEISSKMGLTGKESARQLFHESIIFILESRKEKIVL